MENQNPMPSSGGQVPPPPSSGSVDIRTQQSDIQSIKQSGGSTPLPSQFNLGQSVPSSPSVPEPINLPPPIPPPPSPNNFGLPPSPPSSSGESIFNPADASATPAPSGGADFKKISLIIGIVVAVAALIWVGYIYIYPLFFSSSPALELLSSPAPAVVVTPVAPPPLVHSSFVNFDASLPSLSVPVIGTFRSDLANALSSASALVPDSIMEVKVQNALGEPGAWSIFLNTLIPEITSETAAAIFADDFTAFVYVDNNLKSWPGFIAKLKSSASLVDAGFQVRALESSIFLPNLFLADSGTPAAAGFKDGQVNVDIPTRYLTYSSGAVINYFWIGDYFVLVTSYPGAQKVIPLIQTSNL